MSTEPQIDFERLLAGPGPLLALRQAVADELQRGADRSELNVLLTDEMLTLRAAGREDDEEIVTSVLEFLVGWCSPHMAI